MHFTDFIWQHINNELHLFYMYYKKPDRTTPWIVFLKLGEIICHSNSVSFSKLVNHIKCLKSSCYECPTCNCECEVSVAVEVIITSVPTLILLSQVWYEQGEISREILISNLNPVCRFSQINLHIVFQPSNTLSLEISAGTGQENRLSRVLGDFHFCRNLQTAVFGNTKGHRLLLTYRSKNVSMHLFNRCIFV